MPIEPVIENKEEKEEQKPNQPLLNIQLPAPMSGDPNAPLSVGRHNAAAQHNFQQIANILMTIINNQKMMGMAINQINEKQRILEELVNKVSENIRNLLKEENGNNEPNANTSDK